jgi:uncharacterized protein (DUF433 family)
MNPHPHLGEGIYTLSEVSRYARTASETVRYWFIGHPGRPHGLLSCRGTPAIQDPHRSRQFLTVSFHDLIDSYVVARFRERGVSLQYLRKVYDALTKRLRHPHPFSRNDFFTDGRKVFVSCEDGSGGAFLEELLTSQESFEKIVKEYLTQIIYDESTSLAIRWQIGGGVVIDPARRYGKPIVDRCGIPTCVLATALGANGDDARRVADWFDVSVADVSLAADFERAFTRVA